MKIMPRPCYCEKCHLCSLWNNRPNFREAWSGDMNIDCEYLERGLRAGEHFCTLVEEWSGLQVRCGVNETQCQFCSGQEDPQTKNSMTAVIHLRLIKRHAPGMVLKRQKDLQEFLKVPTKQVTTEVPTKGPGTELHKILMKWGIQETSKCGCLSHVTEMDNWGPDKCTEKIEDILDWMKKEANARGMPFIRMVARKVVKIAIKRARKKLAKLN